MPSTKETEDQKRQRRIQEMREKLERLAGDPSCIYLADDLKPEIQEKFLEQVLAFEGAGEVSLFDELEKGGTALPPPKALDDEQLHAKLWEVIRSMALLGHYLYNTDHLSDRQLYTLLWKELLREPTTVLPDRPGFACHIDILGGWSEEDTRTYLKYYADEEERLEWSEERSDEDIPPHEDPPHDRDRHLPGAECGARGTGLSQ